MIITAKVSLKATGEVGIKNHYRLQSMEEKNEESHDC